MVIRSKLIDNINLNFTNCKKYNSSKLFVNLENLELCANKNESQKNNIL